jgi:hypothetical protein
MKKILYFLAIMLITATFHSCETEEDFDETLLIGRWEAVSKSALFECYRYKSDHTGYTWNPSEDQLESEGQNFTWRIVKSELRNMHLMEIGGAEIPEIVTITELTETTLKYKDSFGSYTFRKMK